MDPSNNPSTSPSPAPNPLSDIKPPTPGAAPEAPAETPVETPAPEAVPEVPAEETPAPDAGGVQAIDDSGAPVPPTDPVDNYEESHKGTYILLAIFIILLMVGGFLFLKNQNAKKKSDAADRAATAAAAKAETTAKEAAPKVATKTEQKYLIVTEWGIKLPVADPISDAYYVVSTGSKDANGQPNTMWLGLKSLDSAGCPATAANTGGSAIAALLRTSPTDTDPVSGTSYKKLYPDGTTIGNYYYAYKDQTKGKTCAPAAKLQAINTALSTASKSIVAK